MLEAGASDGCVRRTTPGGRAVLMRFVDYEAGSVLVAGRELREVAGSAARRVITGMTQDAHVFHTTILANLLLARPDATDTDLREAVRRARLLEWVQSRPDGWDTLLGEDGTAMSGGQRSRPLLARALLADRLVLVLVLVLDEPTEGLDPDPRRSRAGRHPRRHPRSHHAPGHPRPRGAGL
ncbi:ATP-binding cassette domain-containing protein [Streptomyces sp. NPDC017890]|uniref:ATP-binding cassette domain-containing protein n=1 Tax=Streptomyces sp. NPDC017890 TaxID=3365015 RepID=UPI0037B68E5F